MAKIKIGDLRKATAVPKKNKIKEVDFEGLILEVQQYLPVSDKIAVAEAIFESATNREDGLLIVDGNLLDIAFKVLIVSTYTNIILPKDSVEAYDLLCETGLYNIVADNIPQDELTDLQIALNNTIDKERDLHEQNNNIVNILKNFLGNIVSNLPDEKKMQELLKGVNKELAQLEPDKLQFVQDFMKVNRGERIG